MSTVNLIPTRLLILTMRISLFSYWERLGFNQQAMIEYHISFVISTIETHLRRNFDADCFDRASTRS